MYSKSASNSKNIMLEGMDGYKFQSHFDKIPSQSVIHQLISHPKQSHIGFKLNENQSEIINYSPSEYGNKITLPLSAGAMKILQYYLEAGSWPDANSTNLYQITVFDLKIVQFQIESGEKWLESKLNGTGSLVITMDDTKEYVKASNSFINVLREFLSM